MNEERTRETSTPSVELVGATPHMTIRINGGLLDPEYADEFGAETIVLGRRARELNQLAKQKQDSDRIALESAHDLLAASNVTPELRAELLRFLAGRNRGDELEPAAL